MVTREGRVKILDFGLAKQRRTVAEANATLTEDLTQTLTVMGTAAYMSPEQVRGEAVDHRSDIFCLGLILHEMLSGKRTFTGESSVHVMHAILTERMRRNCQRACLPGWRASWRTVWRRRPAHDSSPRRTSVLTWDRWPARSGLPLAAPRKRLHQDSENGPGSRRRWRLLRRSRSVHSSIRGTCWWTRHHKSRGSLWDSSRRIQYLAARGRTRKLGQRAPRLRGLPTAAHSSLVAAAPGRNNFIFAGWTSRKLRCKRELYARET